MSASNEQAKPASQVMSAGRVSADGKRIYRLTPPLAIWWIWVVVVAVSLGDLIIQGHDFISLKFGLGLLTATGLVYASTLWPKVIANDAGLIVHNPLRTFDIPWSAVKGIFLADSVEVKCARPMPKKDKTVYSWALSSGRRSRARSQMRALQSDRRRQPAPSNYGRAPDAAKALARTSPADLMARELAQLCEEAKVRRDGPPTEFHLTAFDQMILGQPSADQAGETGADPANIGPTDPSAVVTAKWAWLPIAAIVVPAIAFVIALLA